MQPEGRLRELLAASGAVACGFAEAGPVEESEWQFFERWLEKGYNAGMAYMGNHRELRRDPRLLLPGARTLISTAFNYRQPNPYGKIATYALGEDYHKVLRRKLMAVVLQMKEEFGGAWRICIDSAPVLERYWARKCGIGRRSSYHGNIIVEGVGSMVFLAEIITTLSLAPTGELPPVEPAEAREAARSCPTGALMAEGMIDSRRCINYLTIEKRGELTDEEQSLMEKAGRGRLFGCDACQLADPCNRGEAVIIDEFRPYPNLREIISSLEHGEEKGVPVNSPLRRSPLIRQL